MSPFAPNPDRDRVLEATDLVALIGEHIALRPKGREHVGLCPFHDDRSPSFQVVSHKGTPFYKCFACGASGNAFDFLINYHKMSFFEALKHLAARAGIELTARQEREEPRDGVRKDDLYRANQLALKLYRRLLADPSEGTVARDAIQTRRIAAEMVEAFQLGYAPDRRDAIESALARATAMARETGRDLPPTLDAFVEAGVVRDGRYGRNDLLRHRLVFPICDDLGRPIAFGGRKLREEDEPKYLNSPESPLFHKSKALYGIHLAKQHIIKSDVAIVTEGYTDVIACHEAGIRNVVATLGTALTRDHARILQRLCSTVVLLFDGDAAGQRAADRGVEVFFAERIDVKVCTLPDDLDPDELLREPGGVDIFKQALAGAVDALTYFVRRFRAEYTSKTGLSGKQKSLEALLAKLVELGFNSLTGIRRQFILSSLASATGLSERDLEQALPQARPSRADIVRVDEEESAEAASADNVDARIEVVPISRARREAERFLLAHVLANPSVFHESVPVLDPDDRSVSHSLPFGEACQPSAFREPDFRAIYRTWHEIGEAGQTPTFTLVLSELAEQRWKGLASDLVLLGEQLTDRDERATLDRVREAYLSLERIADRERNVRQPGPTRPSGVTTDAQPAQLAQLGWRSTRDSSSLDASNEPALAAARVALPTETATVGAASGESNGESGAPAGTTPTVVPDLASDAVRLAEARLRAIRERGPDMTRVPRRGWDPKRGSSPQPPTSRPDPRGG